MSEMSRKRDMGFESGSACSIRFLRYLRDVFYGSRGLYQIRYGLFSVFVDEAREEDSGFEASGKPISVGGLNAGEDI